MSEDVRTFPEDVDGCDSEWLVDGHRVRFHSRDAEVKGGRLVRKGSGEIVAWFTTADGQRFSVPGCAP
jgi:hypothetical protein